NQEENPVEKNREVVKSLVINGKNLVGALKLKGFTNLEELSVSGNQLTKLVLSDCPNLVNLNCENNQLTQLNIKGGKKLTKINCSNNKLPAIGLNDCPNLVEVNCSQNEFSELSFFSSMGELKILEMKNNKKISPPS